MKFASILAVILLAACSPDDPIGDGGADGDGSAGNDENYCIGHGVQRALVASTRGFCRTYNEVDDSCTTVEDCIGYRVPITWPCCNDDPESQKLDCAFANRDSFPDCPECTADEACRKVPRACRDGHCVADLPDDTCETDYDCTLIETGCACVPGSKSVVEYQPVYGTDCTGLKACPQRKSEYSRCVEGHCYMVGPFMDHALEKYCQICGGIEVVENCFEILKSDGYSFVAKYWLFYRAILLAKDCGAFINGPGSHMFYCISVLCP
jgi:hypothetical protein